MTKKDDIQTWTVSTASRDPRILWGMTAGGDLGKEWAYSMFVEKDVAKLLKGQTVPETISCVPTIQALLPPRDRMLILIWADNMLN